jgi:uncharacterized protein (TIGR02246 family)
MVRWFQVIRLPLVTLLLLTGMGLGARLYAQDAVIKELLRLEDVWGTAEAAKDGETVGRLLTEDFVMVGPDGSMTAKAKYIEYIRTNKDEYISAGDTDRKVRVYGNAAVVTGLWTQTVKSGSGQTTSRYRWTCVWIKQDDGRWLCVTAQTVLSTI